MKVLALTSKTQEILPEGITKAKDIDDLMRNSDVISLHCPLTPDTEHIINKVNIAKMKRNAIIINTGRGPLVDDQAVADALKAKRLYAFCADVLTEEPPKADNPLLGLPNAYTTPHIAWATVEARARLIQVAIDNVKAFASGQPQNIV
jgi:glycerate dehydrogenase